MNILLVDDNTHALNQLKYAVKEVCPDEEIQAFILPSDAIAYAEKNRVDIAFLDIEMNGMNGIALAKQLKDFNPAIRLVFCTGYSEYAIEALRLHASGYLMKPIAPEDIKDEIEAMKTPYFMPSSCRVVIQTFGNFDVFVDGKLVKFNRNKSKEILAILVDQAGATVRVEDIADLIWEGDTIVQSRQKQLYTIISDMRKALAKVHAEDIIVKSDHGYAIDKTKVDCDYYRLLDGDISVLNKYDGRYMYEYSWAEFTVGKIQRFF